MMRDLTIFALKYLCFFVAIGLLYCFPGPTEAADYAWVQPNQWQWALLDYDRPSGQRQVGIWDTTTDLYTPIINGEWGVPCDCPAMPPPGYERRRRKPKDGELPTGVDQKRIPTQPKIWHRGKQISLGEAMDLLAKEGDKKIPDDKHLRRVSIIGSATACAAPLAVAKKHAEYVTVDYRPDAWMIERQGFYLVGDPTIYIQQADGTVLRRLDGYEGDEKFEAILSDLDRKISPDPNYDPSKDEGWLPKLKPLIPRLPNVNIPWLPVAVIAGLLVIALFGRKQKL